MRVLRSCGVLLLALAAVVTAADDEREALPIRIDAEVIEKEGEAYLKVGVVNLTKGEVVVRKDLAERVDWDTSVSQFSTDRTFNGGISVRGSVRCGGVATPGGNGPLALIERLRATPGYTTTLAPGAIHFFTVPLKDALQLATKNVMKEEKSLKGMKVRAKLKFRNVILASPGADEARTLALFEKRFGTPWFRFENGAWEPAR